MKRTKFLFAAIMSVLMITGLNAQTYTFAYSGNNSYSPEKRINMKIKKGIRSGELTKNEVRKLSDKIEYIDRLKRKAWRDGHLSRRDRKRINNEMQEFDRMFYKYMHNRYRNHNRYDRHGHDDKWGYEGYNNNEYDYYYDQKRKKGKKRSKRH